MMRLIKYMAGIIIITLMLATSLSAATLDNREKLSLELEAVSLPMVLNMIAQQYHLNLVVSGDVKGDVSLRLENVDIETALETILHPNGYNFYVKNDVIVVKPVTSDAIGELEFEVVTLKYVEAATAKKALEALKSPKGQIVILQNQSDDNSGSSQEGFTPNRLAITDFPSVVSKMMQLIGAMDVAQRLISIEVKIVETNVDSQSELGLSWPTAINTNLGYGSVTNSADNGSTTQENMAATYSLNSGVWTWGTLSVDQLSAVLSLLKEEGNSKLVSDPHLTTVENHEATIKIQTVIPIPTVTRFTEGAATQDIQTFYDEEVGISLVVTPRINEDGRITLDVAPTVEDIIGYTGSVDAQKPITISRSIRTRIVVDDGETAALGGLLKEDVIKSQRKVPLLGSIPFLGKVLFTSTSEEMSTTDLVILITPHILQ